VKRALGVEGGGLVARRTGPLNLPLNSLKSTLPYMQVHFGSNFPLILLPGYSDVGI